MPKTMAIHQDLNRAYVSMNEGMLFVFDISELTPIVIHSVVFPYYIKRLSLDPGINLLQCLTKRGSLICLQLSSKNPQMTEPTAYVESKSELKEEDSHKINSF